MIAGCAFLALNFVCFWVIQNVKFGVVTLSETLQVELRGMNAKVRVSVLCPGWVNTRINESERNRPGELAATDGAR